jgi:hypothetical protein
MDVRMMVQPLGDLPHLVDEGQGGLEIILLIRLQQLRVRVAPTIQPGQGLLDLVRAQSGAHENTLFHVPRGVNARLKEDPYCE